MRFPTCLILATVLLALNFKAHAADCGVPSTTTIDPPSGTTKVATMDAVGDRFWDCKAGKLLNASQIDGNATLTGDGVAAGSNFIYVGDVAKFTWVKEGGEELIFVLDPNPVLVPQTDKLSEARWTVKWVEPAAGPPGVGSPAYLTRTETVGGVTPTKCSTLTAKQEYVPFEAVYTMYACDSGTTPASAATTMHAATAIFAAIFAVVALIV